jgi:predicted NodU family carbamoyl transferase
MTDRFDRIEKAFDNFRSKVEQCRDEANSNMADIQDAYNCMDILRNRYKYEAYVARSLNSTEIEPLQNVFHQYAFMEGMQKIRVIGHHVTGDLHLYDINNSPFELAVITFNRSPKQ